MRLARLLCILALLAFTATTVFAQTGKIAGQVIDDAGETMPGVNVAMVGTTQGAVTDVDGFYFINNVRPGTYTLRASFIGFVSETVENIRVSTGLTTETNFTLREEAVGLAEIVVTSERPIVQLDVSANVSILDPADFVDLPIAGVSEVLDLQAGIEPGLQIRGGGVGEIAFVVDGMNLRTGRDHNPFTNISYTSLEEVQVQTGGFNAEYGNVRSGIVNVTTKEPPRDRYTFDGLFRLAPAQAKSRGGLPEDFDSYYIRPFTDPETAFGGTGVWDIYTQRQYNSHEGWNAVAERLQTDGFDVTPQDMLDYFNFVHRKDNEIDIPDYEADFTLGGPLIPGVSEKLGDLRFLASYRGTQKSYIWTGSRDSFDENTVQLKLISNVGRGMKLTLHGMKATERGNNRNRNIPDTQVWRANLPNYPWQSTGAANQAGRDSAAGGDAVEPMDLFQSDLGIRAWMFFSDGALALANIDHTLLGANFTHSINASTFYEVSLQSLSSKYRSSFPNLRDGSFVCPASGTGPNGQACNPGAFVPVLASNNFGRPTPANLSGFDGAQFEQCFGGSSDINGDGSTVAYCVGDEPFGFAGQGGNLLGGTETTGGHWVKTRDTSDVSVFTGKFAITSQVNRFLQIKTGVELIVSDYDLRYGRVNLALVGPDPEQDFPFSRTPIQGAAFVQGKLEFQGMIANLGMRLDYFDVNTEWWVIDNPYDAAFRGRIDALDANLPKENPKAQVNVSPRLGVSFPITDDSKLYFNYGHFRQMLNPFTVFGIRQRVASGIDVIGNPDHPMPLTVAYELGFDQNIADQFLLRISGFYRDVRDQPRSVTFEGLGDFVNYQTREPWNYRDIRGAEFTLTKTRGRWVRGFFNFTFLQQKSGNFGFAEFDENSFEQRNYLRTSTDYRLNSPIASPFARLNLIFITPQKFANSVLSGDLLGDWRVSLLGEWRDGVKHIWSGGGGDFPELQENVSWRDWINFDLRFTKHINTRFGGAQLFIDVNNIFNRRHLYQQSAFHIDNRDWDRYMWSLHLPGDIFDDLNNVDGDAAYRDKDNLPYIWVPGDDKPGEIRDTDVAFQPIEPVISLDAVNDPNQVAWYWAKDTGAYSQWNGSSFEPVSDGEVQKVLDDKGYIDMPNLRFNTFLNPRRITLGLRVNF